MDTEEVPMGPPPIPNSDRSLDAQSSAELIPTVTSQLPRVPMGPPPPVNLINSTQIVVSSEASLPEKTANPVDNLEMEVLDQKTGASAEVKEKNNATSVSQKSKGFASSYTIPSWSEHPGHPFYFEVLKDGIIMEQLDVSKKGAYMFGRVDLCDFVLEHPTISRFHAVLQFKKSGEAFLYDLSTHGTSINKSQVTKKVYTDLRVGDVIRFGQSSRLYIFQGPVELMPEEADLGKLRKYKTQEEIKDREASLLRARIEASLADGISWGMEEDAPVEEDEDGADEVTWQTYKGQLTDRQEKTRSKIIKRMEKIANMRKEIDAIRAKDIAQGGLTQGQQTQIARNEQRMSQIMEELESLEETLNQSIQESFGARVKKISHSKKKGTVDEEEEDPSDDDDFYDRTKKTTSLKKSNVDPSSVETADTLLDKKEAILREMEERTILLQKEKTKTVSETVNNIEKEDALDAFMTDVSSELALDVTMKIQKEITVLQFDLDRILYLLKIADPTGEAVQKRDLKPFTSNPVEPCSLTSSSSIPEKILSTRKKISNSEKPAVRSEPSQPVPSEKTREKEKDIDEERENKTPAYAPMKPQWLGAVKDMQTVDSHVDEPVVEVQEPGQFIDYKDRKKALAPTNGDREIEDAAPGLILRKRKHTEEPSNTAESTAQDLTSTLYEVETTAADAVALLLKHKRGYCTSDDEFSKGIQENKDSDLSQKKSQAKRVLGPEKPAFLENNRDYESWVPPKGQSGDGRTSLNDKFGY